MGKRDSCDARPDFLPIMRRVPAEVLIVSGSSWQRRDDEIMRGASSHDESGTEPTDCIYGITPDFEVLVWVRRSGSSVTLQPHERGTDIVDTLHQDNSYHTHRNL
jgi:hypothetical protein